MLQCRRVFGSLGLIRGGVATPTDAADKTLIGLDLWSTRQARDGHTNRPRNLEGVYRRFGSSLLNAETVMSKSLTATDPDGQPEIRRASDRLMVILGQALLDEIEKAENDGEDITAWQFGALDALTKQLSGAITAVVTMLKQLGLSQGDFVVFRQRVHQQLEPAVLALLNAELAKIGVQGTASWPPSEERGGHA